MWYKVNRARPGFLLLELLIAISLIGTLSILMHGIYIQIIDTQKSADNLIKATEVASHLLKQYSNTLQNTSGELVYEGFKVSEHYATDTVLKNMQWHSVEVFWKEKNREKQLVLKRGNSI